MLSVLAEVDHFYNTSYLEGRDWEAHNWRPACGKSQTHLKKQARCDGVHL
jgi:hypothetical protein